MHIDSLLLLVVVLVVVQNAHIMDFCFVLPRDEASAPTFVKCEERGGDGGGGSSSESVERCQWFGQAIVSRHFLFVDSTKDPFCRDQRKQVRIRLAAESDVGMANYPSAERRKDWYRQSRVEEVLLHAIQLRLAIRRHHVNLATQLFDRMAYAYMYTDEMRSRLLQELVLLSIEEGVPNFDAIATATWFLMAHFCHGLSLAALSDARIDQLRAVVQQLARDSTFDLVITEYYYAAHDKSFDYASAWSGKTFQDVFDEIFSSTLLHNAKYINGLLSLLCGIGAPCNDYKFREKRKMFFSAYLWSERLTNVTPMPMDDSTREEMLCCDMWLRLLENRVANFEIPHNHEGADDDPVLLKEALLDPSYLPPHCLWEKFSEFQRQRGRRQSIPNKFLELCIRYYVLLKRPHRLAMCSYTDPLVFSPQNIDVMHEFYLKEYEREWKKCNAKYELDTFMKTDLFFAYGTKVSVTRGLGKHPRQTPDDFASVANKHQRRCLDDEFRQETPVI